MRFDQPADESADGRENDSPERDAMLSRRSPQIFRGSRQRPVMANRQIVLMILSLIMVLYAMYEAGKPERWHWLIPPLPPEAAEENLLQTEPSKPESKVPPDSLKKSAEYLRQPETPPSDPATRISAEATFDFTEPQAPLRDSENQRSGNGQDEAYPEGSVAFWQSLLMRLTARERDDFYLMLKHIRDGQTCPQLQQQSYGQLVDQISRARAEYHDQLFQNLAFASSDSKPALTNQWFESQQVWESSEQPSLTAFVEDRKISQSQRLQMERLQSRLDSMFYDWVQDRTAQGWEGDSPAWGRIWEQVLQLQKDQAIPVTHLELSSQPSHYRGKPVEVKGWVRAARREALTVKELGIEQMFVLVIRPQDSRVSPFFVYTTQLPDGFPPIGDRFVSLNKGVLIRGYFFKIRTYLDTENKVQNSPMILTRQVQPWSVMEPATNENDVREFLPKIAPALLILPLVAAGLAWWLFRVTNIVRFRPGNNRTREIHRSLEELAKNPDIKTPRERVDELYD